MSRYLQYLGYEVTYVRNFTDVDDKVNNSISFMKWLSINGVVHHAIVQKSEDQV